MLKYLLIVVIALLLFAISLIKSKLSNWKYFILKTIFIVLLLEVTVFNINSYRTEFGNSKLENFYGEDLENAISITPENTQYVYFSGLNTEVKSVYLELEGLEEDEIVDYDISYSDNSTSNRYLATKTYCQDVEKTKYSVISLSRKMQVNWY